LGKAREWKNKMGKSEFAASQVRMERKKGDTDVFPGAAGCREYRGVVTYCIRAGLDKRADQSH